MNAFDAFRTAAAILVLAGHSFVLTGHTPVPRVFGLPLETIGLYAFFGLSGHLISQSWDRSRDPLSFLTNRALRIFPALWTLVALTTFVIGPALSDVSPSRYFSSPTTWSYLLNGALIGEYKLPGLFEDHATTAVNGSLWTLGVEFTCYSLVIAFGLLLRERATWAWVFVAFIAAWLADPYGGFRHSGPLVSETDVIVAFAIGAILAHVSGVVLTSWWWPILATAAIPAANLAGGSALAHIAAWCAIPLIVVSIGRRSVPLVRQFGKMGDPSYGIYVWGYLIQQVMVSAGMNTPGQDLLASLLVSIPLAYVSWHVIEKNALVNKANLTQALRLALAKVQRKDAARGVSN